MSARPRSPLFQIGTANLKMRTSLRDMKKFFLVFALPLAAAAAGAKSSLVTDLTYTSEYIFRGLERAGGSVQPSVEATAGDFSLGLWTSQPLRHHENNEVDCYGVYQIRAGSVVTLEALANA